MDTFYGCLPGEKKIRLHFHHFMARIHQQLNDFSGEENPLVLIADDLSRTYKIICFDEFFVSDIADAMILAGLFEHLFKREVVLVATSNVPIQRLYENGLARHKFLPCIALLKQYTKELQLDGKVDHRLHVRKSTSDPSTTDIPSPYISLTGDIDFHTVFNELSDNTSPNNMNTSSLKVCHRDIPIICALEESEQSNSVAWFDFRVLCESHRSQLDYMEIANRFGTVMLSGVPTLSAEVRGWIKARGTEDGTGDNQAFSTGERTVSYASTDNTVRRFIALIDELYDQNVTLYLSADVPLTELYKEGALLFEFRRTYSRLIEMSQRN
jgi:cell division protein ZapE